MSEPAPTADAPAPARQPPTLAGITINPGAVAAVAGTAFAVGLGASWIMARRGRSRNTPTVRGNAAARRAAAAARRGPAVTSSKAEAALVMRQGAASVFRMTTGNDEDPGSVPPADNDTVVFALKAFAAGTALAVGAFVVGVFAVSRMLDAHDIPTFHAKMQALMGPRLAAWQDAVRREAVFLQVPEKSPEEEAADPAWEELDRVFAAETATAEPSSESSGLSENGAQTL
ncbi:hypothetical protein AMAG_12245 [Allomyces macrogynus ATCC 38327]|uniref:Transmembrane protein 242 n=1 Tax=Allomyces macrogynus (strain ATCC 38327) TaxID=578462 RepID=A0A0L0SXE2_ALLM3|nr:hypothetical protein AMAG_12245 [Allomyces macrogynus ATCC 38327]|eukprot:KNE67177.1 hypothetical protein AMAG_12245 [Allomyces macrogynus ATCC 38327]